MINENKTEKLFKKKKFYFFDIIIKNKNVDFEK